MSVEDLPRYAPDEFIIGYQLPTTSRMDWTRSELVKAFPRVWLSNTGAFADDETGVAWYPAGDSRAPGSPTSKRNLMTGEVERVLPSNINADTPLFVLPKPGERARVHPQQLEAIMNYISARLEPLALREPFV